MFVDVQNLYHSAKHIYHDKVDFSKVLESCIDGRKLIRAIAYVIEAHTPDQEDFFNLLKKFGYEVKSKELKTYVTGEKKGDWDMGLAIDAIKIANKVDTIVLVSGDGDFVYLVNHLQAHGVRVEVMAFEQSTSGKLKEEADYFRGMEEKKERFLINS